jgi:uncharacterized protein DUF3309
MFASAPNFTTPADILHMRLRGPKEMAFGTSGSSRPHKENFMSLGTILLIVLILLLVGAIPTWPHSRSWGYAPSGLLGFVVLIIVVLLLLGRL